MDIPLAKTILDWNMKRQVILMAKLVLRLTDPLPSTDIQTVCDCQLLRVYIEGNANMIAICSRCILHVFPVEVLHSYISDRTGVWHFAGCFGFEARVPSGKPTEGHIDVYRTLILPVRKLQHICLVRSRVRAALDVY